MSAKTARVARPVKPKVVDTTPAQAVQSAQSAQVTQPAQSVQVAQSAHSVQQAEQPVQPAHTVSDQTTQTNQTAQPEADGGKRQQTGRIIDCDISSARARRHMDKMNLNYRIDTLISELKTPLDEYKHAKTCLDSGKVSVSVEKEVEKDGKKVRQTVSEERPLTDAERTKFHNTVAHLGPSVARLEADIAAYGHERTRFSNTASVALAVILNELVYQIGGHAMNSVLAAKKKIIQIEHIHTPGIEKLSLYPLIKNLPTFVATSEKLTRDATETASREALAVALAQAEREFKKKYNVHLSKKKVEAVAPAAPAPAPDVPAPAPVEENAVPELDEEDDSADSKTSFRFYVAQVCKKLIKNNPTYKSVRVSTEIRAYLSDLLVELIRHLSPLIQLTASNMRNKTINDVAILRTVESKLIDGHAAVDTVELRDELVTDPVALKAEFAKRDEAKKNGTSYTVDLEKLPKIQGRVAYRSVSFPTSGFADLEKIVKDKVALFKDSLVDEEDVVPEASA